SKGQLCCDYGSGGKICQDAKSCPRFCAEDSTCETTSGQACVRFSIETSQMVCAPATAGIKTCHGDSDCKDSEVCCGNYKEAICTPANKCPKACTTSADCGTGRGEICCTSVGVMEPNLNVQGLCLNTDYEPCLKSCTTSSDCDATNPLCCDGV